MTWKELHIGIDVTLKTLNHNLLGRYLPEEKDYLLNSTLTDLVHKAAEDAKHSVINVESYADIAKFYNILEPYLIRKELEFTTTERRVEAVIPKYLNVLDSQGNEIIKGVTYKVDTIGNLNSYSGTLGTSYVEDDVFTWNPANVVFGSDGGGGYQLDILVGVKYKILRSDSIDFTTYGATDNNVGTIFVSNATYSFVDGLLLSTELEILSFTPPTWTNIVLIALKNLNKFTHIAVNALVSTGSLITYTNGIKLEKGKYYRVTAAGEFSNLTSYGSEYNIVEVGYTFIATATGIPTYVDPYTGVLEICYDVPCRLVKPQDISSFLEHSYGTAVSSPLCVMEDEKILIYHDYKFDVRRSILIYVRPPAKIDSVVGIDCDLNENLHPMLVAATVQNIVATNNPQLYQTVTNQVNQQKT